MKKGALSKEPSYRNKLEESVGTQFAAAGIPFDYEGDKIPYEVPQRIARYWPDFRPRDCNIIVETKGRFDNARERQKYVLLKDQRPDLDIRFCFSRAAGKIYKGSRTTYAKWADDHGFKWCDKGRIPAEWLDEIKQQQAETKRCRSSRRATGS